MFEAHGVGRVRLLITKCSTKKNSLTDIHKFKAIKIWHRILLYEEGAITWSLKHDNTQ